MVAEFDVPTNAMDERFFRASAGMAHPQNFDH